MADDRVDSDPAQSGEEDTESPKKTFGILAARFLQKGKSSPGSITGEFEALHPPGSTADSKVRNTNPIDDDDDDVREGSIHGIEVPLNESLYADIGLDDMPSFGDAEADSGAYSGAYSNENATQSTAEDTSNDVVYDIDDTERPIISHGGAEEPTETEADISESSEKPHSSRAETAEISLVEPTESNAASSIEEEPAPSSFTSEHEYSTGHEPEAAEQQQYSHEENQSESEPAERESVTYTSAETDVPAVDYEAEHQGQDAKRESEHDSELDSERESAQGSEPEFVQESEQGPELESAQESEHDSMAAFSSSQDSGENVASSIDEPAEYYSQQPNYESTPYESSSYESTAYDSGSGASEIEHQPTSQSEQAAYDLSALNAIGQKDESSSGFDKNTLDQIGTEAAATSPAEEPPAVPEKKGLLGKFASKKDSSVRPLIGGVKKVEPDQGLNKSTDDAGAGSKPFDAAALDSIGSKSYDSGSLDSIGAKPYDSGSLDSIGAKPYDPGSLDSIGTNSYAPGSLDSIGSTPFDGAALDQIGAPSEPPAPEKEKPAAKGGGLLGGKLGQRAKGAEKPKLGGAIMPPSTDPSFDQKETGRFMVNQEALSADPGALTQPQAEASASADFAPEASAPDDPYQSIDAAQEPSPAASEAPSGSFFDASIDPLPGEIMPVIPGDEIGRLLTDADNAYRVRQFKAAEPIFANVLEKLDKVGNDNDPLLPYCLDKMGDNFYQMKRYKEALQVYRRLLVLQTKISSADRDMISTLYKIAQTSENLNLTSEADSMYKRAFRLGQQSLVPGDPLLAKVLEGYGTMLMRSEGAEPPTAGGAAAAETDASDKSSSSLSADEIKMLNELKVKGDAASEAGSPIILSGGPGADGSLTRTGSRVPLRETDERTEKVRASAPGPTGTTASGVWVRLGIFVAVVAGLLFFVFNMKSDFSTTKVAHSKDFPRKSFKTLDGNSTFNIVNEDEASKDHFGKHYAYEYANWSSSPANDMEVISGQISGNNFVYLVPQGVRQADGLTFYEINAPEHTTTAKMKELGRMAQAYYKQKGKYPEGKDLDKLTSSLSYKNPFAGGANSVAGNTIGWPANMDPTQVFVKSKFDSRLEDGELWDGEAPAKPGLITAASSSQKNPDASLFYIHGRDRTGSLITRADSKVLILIYKNGIDVTPAAVDVKNETPSPDPAPLRIAKSDIQISPATVLLSYIPILIFLVLTVVFLALSSKGPDPTKNFSVSGFGIIWAPVMVLLTALTKFAPPAFTTAAIIAAILAGIGGLGWIGFKIWSGKPKKPKKPKIEASTM